MNEINEPILRYTINVGDFLVGEDVYPDRCLSASYSGAGVPAVEIPWADGEHQPWDYRAEYEMVDVEISEPVIDPETGEETGEITTRTETQKHYTGEFAIDPIMLPEPEPAITSEQRISELEAENAELQDALLEVGGIIAEQDETNAMLEDAILELAEIMGGM